MISLDAARGTKRTCQACAARYYDLGRPAPVCPKCGVDYVEPPRALPTYRVRRARIPAAAPVAVAAVEVEAPVMDGKNVDDAVEDVEDTEDEEQPEVEAEAETEEADKPE